MRRLACIGLLGLMMGAACAADYRAGPQNYRELLRQLRAGDRLLLEPGNYVRGLPLRNLAGQPGRPIIIEAADPDAPPRLLARPGANTVSLVDVRHVTLRHLELDGRNVPVDAIKAEGHSRYADHVTLEHLYIHDHAASQQSVGISTKCPAFGWVVRHTRIERVGTGLYLGDSDGSDAFVAGLIEGNHISQTLGYNLQIKHQRSRAVDHGGPHETVIRYNVFSKADAQPGPLARPNLLLGHGPLQGPGREDRYLVYGNVFLDNPSEALLQAEGRVAIYDNVFVNSSGDAIRIQPHNDVPRDMAIFANTVLASGVGIAVRQPEGAPYRQRLLANVVAAAVPIQGGEATHNVVQAYRPTWLELPAPELIRRLLADTGGATSLPDALVDELAAYPGWRRSARPGAILLPERLPSLNGSLPR
ncbi:MAG: hypothetical protein ACLGG6_00160 [Gammaproteobacteria bacterium]